MSDMERLEDLYKAYVRIRPVPEVELIVEEDQTNGRETEAGN